MLGGILAAPGLHASAPGSPGVPLPRVWLTCSPRMVSDGHGRLVAVGVKQGANTGL